MNLIMDSIKLEILQGNYLEHFKFEKDLSMFLPLDHHKRIEILKHSNEILTQIHKITEK